MTTSLRAALSVAMLAGFYVVALALVVGLGALTVLSFEAGPSALGGKLGIFTLVVAGALVVAVWKVARTRPEPEPGLVVGPQDAPELWATVRELAGEAQTRVPDEIRLVGDVNAAVSEDARLLGLVGGHRRLYLGVPLLLALDVAQLRSVLAHELGHYSHSHTRLGAVTYRGRAVILATVAQLSGNVVGWLLKGYARLYLLVSAAVSRQQELEADLLSVRVAGREVAQSTLRELPVTDAAWDFYTGAYLSAGWESGYAPTAPGFFDGFARLLAARGDELARLRDDAPPADGSRWDSHPPIAARIAAMEAQPDTARVRDTRPATALLPDFPHVAAATAEEVVAFADRVRLDWDELTAASVATEVQRAADSVFRAAARLTGHPSGTLATVLDLVAAGRADELAHALGADGDDAHDGHDVDADSTPEAHAAAAGGDHAGDLSAVTHPHPAVAVVEAVLTASAVQAGVGRWQHSWSGPATLVGPDGAPLALDALAADVVRTRAGAEVRDRVAALGIDAERAGQVEATATAHGATVLGGLANLDVNGGQHDVVVLDNGLLLVPCPKKTEGGKNRMLTLLDSAPVVELARRHQFMPFEEVRTAAVLRTTPVRVTFTLHDGSTVALKEKWTGDRLANDSADVLVAAARHLEHAAAPAAP